MALVGRKEHERANRRFRLKQKRKALNRVINDNDVTFNIVGTDEFKVGHFYNVGWTVDGQMVGQFNVCIPADECTSMTAKQWFIQYVRTIMFTFDLKHADIMVAEIIDDTKRENML